MAGAVTDVYVAHKTAWRMINLMQKNNWGKAEGMLLDMDIEALWAPLGEGREAVGPNLEYDPDFMQLEEAARAQPEQEFANSDTGTRLTIEGQGADWPEVFKLAQGLMHRTRDVRVATYFARALVRTRGFVGAQTGLTLINGLLERYWDHIHPELDADDDNDPTMRVNALAPLVASEAFIDDLRSSWILKSRAGVLTLRGIELSQGKLQAREGEEVYSEAQVTGLLAEALAQNAELGAVIDGTIQVIATLSSSLQSHVGSSRSLDFKPLQSILHSVRQAFLLAVPSAVEEEVAEETSGEGSAPVAGSAPAKSGEIRSRQDVVAGIDKLIQYLERAEPTNPAQIMLKRAKRMVNMSFLEVINEIAPDALGQAELILGDQLNKSEN